MPIVEYLVTEKALLYQTVLNVLLVEESHLGIHLPSEEIARRVDAALVGAGHPTIGTGHVSTLLDYLYDRGNVDRIHNLRRYGTLEDFLRRDYLYQLTPEGAQVHRQMMRISSETRMSGALQAAMLPEVFDALSILVRVLKEDPPDLDEVDRNFHRLTAGFTELSENAKLFVQGLNRSLAFRDDFDLDDFLAYKQVVVGYLRAFTVALDRHVPVISGLIGEAEAAGVLDVLARLARRSPTPVMGMIAEEVAEQESRHFAARWAGLRSWFFESGDREPVAHTLQDRASDAVNHIVLTVRQINEQRYRRANRSADLVALASWFDGLEDEDGRTGLWRVAHGMYPARSLGSARNPGDDDHDPHLSWWEGSPAPVGAILRSSGPRSSGGSPPRLADPRKAKSRLAARRRKTLEKTTAAEQSLLARGRFRFSDLGSLDQAEAEVFLDWLGTVFAARPGAGGVRRTSTGDGRVVLTLFPPEEDARATIALRGGTLKIQDFELLPEAR
jgi:uncharacterized protein (TIGR02677 family)